MSFILIQLADPKYTHAAITAACKRFSQFQSGHLSVTARRQPRDPFLVLGRYLLPTLPARPPNPTEWFTYFEGRAIAHGYHMALDWVTMTGPTLHSALISTARLFNVTHIYADQPPGTRTDQQAAYRDLLSDHLHLSELSLEKLLPDGDCH